MSNEFMDRWVKDDIMSLRLVAGERLFMLDPVRMINEDTVVRCDRAVSDGLVHRACIDPPAERGDEVFMGVSGGPCLLLVGEAVKRGDYLRRGGERFIRCDEHAAQAIAINDGDIEHLIFAQPLWSCDEWRREDIEHVYE